MKRESPFPKRNVLQQILVVGMKHWNHEGYDPNARRKFHQAAKCKTSALGIRVYASGTEERQFANPCKSSACTSCGHAATTQWQRERWCALPEGPYCAITFTMPNTLWPAFSENTRLCHSLAEIAARVVVSYCRVHKGIEVGVMPIVQTFNGKMEFNSHVHLLVTARDLQAVGLGESFFFDGKALARSWQRLVIMLLRTALLSRTSGVARAGLESLLDKEGSRSWMPAHVQRLRGKKHFLFYAGRYLRRPPIASRRIVAVTNGLVQFWYEDKRSKETKSLVYAVEEFIDRWAQHVPQHYAHGVRYFGLFAPRIWGRIGSAVFAIIGEKPRSLHTRQRWADSVEKQFGLNPLLDTKGERMRFVKHLPPTPENSGR